MITPKMTQVIGSSNVRAYGYDAEKKDLVVEFLNGGKYRYVDVCANTYDCLKQADSKGGFISKFVKPQHKAHRI